MGNGTVQPNVYGPGDTTQIGGDRFSFWDTIGLNPPGFGPVLANAAYAVPSVPPSYGDPSMTGMVSAGDMQATAAAAAPFSLQASPLLWVVLAIVGGFAAIHLVHWKGE